MRAVRFIGLLTIVLSPLFAARAEAASPKLTVAHITRGDRPATSAPDVTERALNGRLLRRGINVGESLPDEVRVNVPGDDTVVIASGRSTATLQPGSIDTFAWAGAKESVTIANGTTKFDDPLDFYHVNAGAVNASHHSTVFSFTVNAGRVTITVTSGVVEATRVASADSGQHAVAYVEQVDNLSPTRQSSITYTLGDETTADVATRLRAYQIGAARGDVRAEVNLGIMYLNGRGVAADYARAMHYFQLATAQGFAYGESNLGRLYIFGFGVPKDPATAGHYFGLAAAQGDSLGENDLGAMYALGEGVTQDYATAVRYFGLAAAQGNPYGEYNLGYMYALGHGVPKDDATAIHYYDLAGAQGLVEAHRQPGIIFEERRQ